MRLANTAKKNAVGNVVMIVWRYVRVKDVIEQIVGIVMNAMLQMQRGKEIM